MTDEPMDPVEGEEESDGAPPPTTEPDGAESPTTDSAEDEGGLGLTDVPVDELAHELQKRSDPDEIRALMEADPREEAEDWYRLRLEILAATGANVDTGEAQGYTVGIYRSSRGELPNYECASCAYSTLHLERIESHVAIEHRASEPSEEAS